MKLPSTPFDITIMQVTPEMLSRVPRITSTDIYDGTSGNFAPNGLYSTVLFGDIGTSTRDYTFGVIKLNTQIIHPLICKWLKKVKRLHESIWRGEAYAKFIDGEFVECDIDEGETGYYFFCQHVLNLKMKKNKSVKRNQLIDNLIKFRDRYFLEYHLVMPAGLRDIQTDQSGKQTEDEIAEYYRKLIRLSNSLEHTPKRASPELNPIRVAMQETANEIDLYIEGILTGKKGFLLGKWASRTLHLSSRNVISSQESGASVLGDGKAPTVDTVQLGLFQIMAGSRPLVVNLVRNSLPIQWSFPQQYGMALLIDPITKTRKEVQVDDEDIADWTTIEGIDKQILRFEKNSVKHLPAMCNGHYLGLLYDDGERVMQVRSIEELPEGFDKRHVREMSLIEFYYLACEERFNQLMVQCTRYPVTSEMSIFVGDIYCKTTSTARTVEWLDEEGKSYTPKKILTEFPDRQQLTFHDAISLSSCRLSALGGDFDGDTYNYRHYLSNNGKAESCFITTSLG